jgi:hypothetical protein
MSEHLHGPHGGMYIATYACPVGELGDAYIGYARLCAARPRSFWDCQVAAEIILEIPYESEAQAHAAALRHMLEESRRLAPMRR